MAGASISVEQLATLIDFMESHPTLALGRCTRSKEGRSVAKRLWSECADLLNSVSKNCAKKTEEQWRMYYNEYKSKLLKKFKTNKSEESATGGEPSKSKEIKLTPLQERLFTILGRDAGEPLPGVRQNPDLLSSSEDQPYSHSFIEKVRPIKKERTSSVSGISSKYSSRKRPSEALYSFIQMPERDTRDTGTEMDECDLYGRLLAKKMRRLDERQRDIAMHEIDNIMFRAKMNSELPQQSHSSNHITNNKRKMKAPESPVFIVTEQNEHYEEEYLEDPMPDA